MKNQKSKMKSQKFLFFIILGILVFSFLIPQSTQARLVPCGYKGGEPCQFCHFFVLFKNIVEFFLIPRSDLNQNLPIVPLIAILMMVVAGLMFFLYAEDPAKIQQAKSLVKTVVVGLVLIYGAWLIVGLFFQVIGLEGKVAGAYRSWWERGVFQINCPTTR